MRALAQEKTQDHRVAKAPARGRAFVEPSPLPYFAGSDLAAPVLFRKASCSCGGGCPACQGQQSKPNNLNISQPNDPAEIEADQIADRVMRMSITEIHGNLNRPAVPSITNSAIHRKCSSCEEGDEIIRRKPIDTRGGPSSQNPAHVQNAIGGGGHPLDQATRSFFEPRLSYDLSSVRIHTGPLAAESASAIDAKAYTLGRDIVFGKGQYEPETESGRQLLAHEIAHVTQSASPTYIRRDTIYRQPANQICVPGSPEDSPACLEARKREQKIAEDRKPGATVTVTGPNMALPSGAGFKIPTHPDAVKGIHDWSDNYGTANNANNHNKFRVGSMRLQQICQTDSFGNWAVYVYFVTDADGDNYAVGPDSLLTFVMTYGMMITADSGNTDQLGGGRKMLDPRSMPAAPDAFDEDPQMYYVAPKLPAYNQISDAFDIDNYYHMRGYLRHMPNGDLAVLYYIAENLHSDFRPEYVVGPKWLPFFIERIDMYAGMAAFSYPIQKGAMPAKYQALSARYVMGFMKGDPERASSGLDAWGAAAKDPFWWLQVFSGYAGAAQPRPTTPGLRVIQGGKGGAIAPPATTTTVTPGVSTGSVPYVGRGGAAPVMALDTAALPAQVPRPGPVGVPGWNPNPLPVTPGKPMGYLSSSALIGASSRLSSVPRPDVDSDLDKEKKRGKCRYLSIGQQFGRYPCHAAFATHLSGVPREVRITTPEGESVDYDAMDSGQSLYEVKTGYRWLVFMGDPVRVNEVAARFWAQAVEQMLVAEECGHTLRWYFNDPYVASFFGAENAPYPQYFQAPLPVPVWYEPYDCNVDSDG